MCRVYQPSYNRRIFTQLMGALDPHSLAVMYYARCKHRRIFPTTLDQFRCPTRRTVEWEVHTGTDLSACLYADPSSRYY